MTPITRVFELKLGRIFETILVEKHGTAVSAVAYYSNLSGMLICLQAGYGFERNSGYAVPL